ncbi:fluoride efflux transporter CrcB [Streptomyces sp. NRRL F-5123]|uniref:fluoride efflux transporter CrcB n=1 Tax=Streptomyces sp. NRRL F-5123 TaxID=1463856 RepID=UPI0004E278EE|nr:fluoride efflux transporter CrcB [Streptomyces sp. NRRL F-5123]
MTAPREQTTEPVPEPVPLPVPADEPCSPDAPVPPRPPGQGQAPVVAAVAAGGAIGASARYGAGLLWPTATGAFPWTTLTVNVVGCAVIGVLMVLITETWSVHRLVRPFFGTGVLGGFTTFSTYAVDVQQLVQHGHARTALAYLASTLLAALFAVWLAAAATRALMAGRAR